MRETIQIAESHENLVNIKRNQILIDGEFQNSVSGKTFQCINPATEEVITEIAEGDAKDIDRAVQSAAYAFESGPWSELDARTRGHLLYKWADLLEQHSDELVKLETLDTGKPITDVQNWDIPGAITTIRYFAGWADKIHGKTIPISGPFLTYTQREPVGVCGLIIPWNYPLAMAAWKLGPALATGCTTVLKPAEQSPLSALRAGELALEAGIPPGVINIVPGFGPTAGAALVKHPQVAKIAFTGEHTTAALIKDACKDNMKRLSFELGGKSPNIVFADADINLAVDGAFGAIFANQGQNCCAGSRLYVQDTIYDDFVSKLAAKASSRKIGDPFDPTTEHGTQIDQAQMDKILHYINLGKEQGAECVAGGSRPTNKGYYVEPTVFSYVNDKMAIATDEIFGPVVSVMKFTDTNEVIQRANDTMFGLASAVWTQNIDTAQQVSSKLKAGTVWVNCYNVVDPAAPFGGFKMSGIGRELSEQALDAYTETKTVTMLRK